MVTALLEVVAGVLLLTGPEVTALLRIQTNEKVHIWDRNLDRITYRGGYICRSHFMGHEVRMQIISNMIKEIYANWILWDMFSVI